MQISTAYRSMLRIRLLEEKVLACADQNLIQGFIHPYTGQEAVAVGVLTARRPEEWVVSFYRCHGHALAAGSPVEGIVREVLGRAGGLCGGKAGSMHLADRANRFLGASSIVGSQLSIAAGVAMAERSEGAGRACVVFCGDGALGTGVAYETLTIAATLGLPLLVVCEDNGWQDQTPSALVRHTTPAGLAAGMGLGNAEVDGNDVSAVYAAAQVLLDRCRRDSIPQVLVARTYLRHFHAQMGSYRPAEYRPAEEVAHWRGRDPLDLAAARLDTTADQLAELRREVDQELTDVFTAALAAPWPDVATATTEVTSAPVAAGAAHSGRSR